MNTSDTLLRLQKAFAALGYAVKWWYRGPGCNIHVMTAPHEYNKAKHMCLAVLYSNREKECVRCARAILARATIGREKESGLVG